MRKLNLLKPDKRTVYLTNRKNEEVNYLNISEKLGIKALEQDINAGAVHFKECLDIAKKKPAHMVIIDCVNEEEGIMAANYLAAIYNEADGLVTDAGEEEEYFKDNINISEESVSLDVSDFECDPFGEENDFEDNNEVYEESPARLPIISALELSRYSNQADCSFPTFPEDNHFMSGIAVNPYREPYWVKLKREPVCILVEKTNIFSYGGIDNLCKELKRFDSNRHVYVVVVHDAYEASVDYEESDGDDLPFGDFDSGMYYRQKICEIVLEYTANLVEVRGVESQKNKYYKVLFENWAPKFGVKLEKRFPKAEIAAQIVEMNNENKSELIEKVYKYVLAQENVGTILTKEDFAIMKKFKVLGLSDKKKDDSMYLKKLDTTLVGLESVKEQIYEIVDVMKFNKKRAQMGLGNSGFHNVHMMLGAPGTAKTTVAQLMGNIMMEKKLLPGNRFISINGADLKGMFVGHSAPKTKAIFDNNDIILIDEAYSIASEKEMDSFSQEAIAQLIIEIEKHGMDKLVIFAGYGGEGVTEKDNKMIQFLNANPGIRSRINSTIYFESYTPEQMVEIVHCHAKNNKYILGNEADALIREHFAKRYKTADFGNGREARRLLETITLKAACRVMKAGEDKLTKKNMQELKYEDVEAAICQIENSYSQQNGRKRQSLGFSIKEA